MSQEPPLFPASPRTFTQARARKTYERLVEAAEGVFAERGFDATQTPDIAQAAGVSVGTFYRYFDDKRDVFLEVLRRFLVVAYEEAMARLRPERFVGRGQREAIAEVLDALVDSVTRAPKLARVFAEMALRDDKVAELRANFDREAHLRLTEIIRLAVSRERTPDPEATAYVVQTAAVELAASLSGLHGKMPVSRERSLAALATLIDQALFSGQ